MFFPSPVPKSYRLSRGAAKKLRLSDKGADHIKQWESLRLQAYLDGAAVPTIGYGHTGKDVYLGLSISKKQADKLFKKDVERFERGVSKLLKVCPTPSQFDAMVSLAYNIGLAGFKRSSVLRNFNKFDIYEAGESFKLWNKVRSPRTGKLEKSRGLVRRRKSEIELFRGFGEFAS